MDTSHGVYNFDRQWLGNLFERMERRKQENKNHDHTGNLNHNSLSISGRIWKRNQIILEPQRHENTKEHKENFFVNLRACLTGRKALSGSWFNKN